MIQKETHLLPVDKTGALLVKAFHLYRGGRRKVSTVGEFIRVSIRAVKPDLPLRKKQKVISLITVTTFRVVKPDGSVIRLFLNGCILLKRKSVLRSKEITAPGTRAFRRKKLLYKFPGVL